jgi:hypothetical protein
MANATIVIPGGTKNLSENSAANSRLYCILIFDF